MLMDIFIGAVGFGAIGYLFAKPFTDIFAEKMVGGLVGFVIGLVIMAVVKISETKKV